MATCGCLPRAATDSRISSSRTMEARPFTRSVSSRPGIRKIRPTCGFSRTLRSPSSRLLPGRSGITRCRSSSTRTKPGASPLGETSQRPVASDGRQQEEGRVPDELSGGLVHRGRLLLDRPLAGRAHETAQLALGRHDALEHSAPPWYPRLGRRGSSPATTSGAHSRIRALAPRRPAARTTGPVKVDAGRGQVNRGRYDLSVRRTGTVLRAISPRRTGAD